MSSQPVIGTRIVTRDGRDIRLLSTCQIEAQTPSGARRSVRVERPLFTIGSHESNDLVLDDPSVSKHHLELSATTEGHRIVDLASSNGTYFGALKVGAITITEPIVLRLGDTSLRLTPGGEEIAVPAANEERIGSLVGRSPMMRELFAQVEQLSGSDCTVLLEGETGTGKGALARCIHDHSARKNGPFLVLDCAAAFGELFDDELFGHVAGAFSGADEDRRGIFELASGGTLLLDDLGDLPMPLQAKLLAVLDRRKVVRIGTMSARPVDLRIIVSSKHSLAQAVNEGRFRADLFYRIGVVRMRLPPLRERLEDLPLLCAEFLGAENAQTMSAVVTAKLRAQPWPGNVRELKNTVESIRDELPLPGAGVEVAPAQDGEGEGTFFSSRQRAVMEFERAYFLELLSAHDDNLNAVARESGLDRRYLSRILRRLFGKGE